MIPLDTSELSGDVLREFAECRHNREVAALLAAEQEQVAAAREIGEHRSIENVGRLRMIISPTAFHYWGTREGYECWTDKSFLHEFERDNASARVKCGGTKTQVVCNIGFSKKF